MEEKKILEQIIDLCYEINDERLVPAIENIDTEVFREDCLDEMFVVIYEIEGEDSEVDYLIEEIIELYKKLCDL